MKSTRLLSASAWLAPFTLLVALAPCGELRAGEQLDPCTKTAQHAKKSCAAEALEEFWRAIGTCDNLGTPQERADCRREAREAYQEALAECDDQFEARLDICEDLPGAYDPQIDPGDFVLNIDNPYFPLTPGTTRIYEAQTDDGTERIEIVVTHDTVEILGVTCRVVRDTVTLDGELVEDTVDWFAQDEDGNVWYFGELVLNYEDGALANLDGSWKAGVDHAKPGVVMLAAPELDDLYRQEFLLTEAEDVAEILSLAETVIVPYGTFGSCLKTGDFTPIEPDHLEHKYYAPGIGLVLEVNPKTGDRVELIDVEVE